MSHLNVHPEPEEGCSECAHTPRRRPQATIDELLSRARLDFTREVPEDVVPFRLRRLARDAQQLHEDLEDIRNMEPEDFE